MTNRMGNARWIAVLVGTALICGCESPAWVRSLGESFRLSGDDQFRLEATHRKEFQSNRSRQALHWLLANRIESGMSYIEVCQILGDEGEREFVDRWLKDKGSTYRLDDVVYRFGPDDEGHSYYLAFREDRLVNFDPSHFEGSGKSPASQRSAKKTAGSTVDDEP